MAARAVIDASGTWKNPNPVGANGLPAPGEREHRDNIFYGIPGVLYQVELRFRGILEQTEYIGGETTEVPASDLGGLSIDLKRQSPG